MEHTVEKLSDVYKRQPYNWTQAEPSEYAVAIEGGGGYADGYDVQIAKRIAEGLGKELVICLLYTSRCV